MTDTMSFLEWLESRGGQATLSEIMTTTYACEYRKFCSLIRRIPGYSVKVTLNRKEPGKNLYRLIKTEPNGQQVFA